MLAAGDHWPRLVVGLQTASLAVLAVVLLNLFRSLSVPPRFAAPATGLICINPGILAASRNLLPELLLGLLLVLVWTASLRVIATRHALWIGLASGYAALVKPMWVLGALPLAAALALLHRRRLILPAAVLAGHFAVCGAWQAYLLVHFHQPVFSRIGAKNLNLALLRAGFTADAPETPLYQYLQQSGLLDQALTLRWDDLAGFTCLKNTIPDAEQPDPAFYRRILTRHWPAVAWFQLRRWPQFFMARVPGFNDRSFPGMPRLARYLYEGAYAWWFRAGPRRAALPTLLLLLLASFACCFSSPLLRPLAAVSTAIALYFSGVITALTYQDSLFIRMRAGLEPILLFLSLVPLWLLIDRLARARTLVPDPTPPSSSPPRPPPASSAPPAT